MTCIIEPVSATRKACTCCGQPFPLNAPEPIHHDCLTPVPTGPSIARKFWNVSAALVEFVADGCETVDAAEYERRLSICDTCPIRSGNECTHIKCGCYLPVKAKGRAFTCPLGKWGPLLTDSGTA